MVAVLRQPTYSHRLIFDMLEVHITKDKHITIVEMQGELDSSSARDVQMQLLNAVEPDSKIVLDMSRVNYMSSAGLRMLLLLYRRIRENVGQIILTGLNDEVRDVMAITGFLDFFETTETRREAVIKMS
jgi:anti-sigma B factor antagonist